MILTKRTSVESSTKISRLGGILHGPQANLGRGKVYGRKGRMDIFARFQRSTPCNNGSVKVMTTGISS
jgi:hypothetical protein